MSSPPHQLVSDPTNKSKLENLIKTLFPTDEIIMEPESKRVGNREGLNLIQLLNRMTRLEKQLENSNEEQQRQQQKLEEQLENSTKEQQRQQEKLEKHKEEQQRQQQKLEEQQKILEETEYNQLIAHANELEWTAGLGDQKTRYKRNEITHGGNIKLSIRVIAFLEKRDEIRRAQNASIGFKETYGFSIHELRPANAPEEIVELLNIRGTLTKLDIWRSVFHTKSEQWIKACDDIIKDWLRAGGGSASSFRDQAKEKYAKISQEMADCIDSTRSCKTSRNTTG